MTRAEKLILAGLAALGTLTLGLAAATAAAYSRASAPLPTEINLADFRPQTAAGTAGPVTAIGLVRLAPLTLAEPPEPPASAAESNAPAVNAAPAGPTFDPNFGYQFSLGRSVQGRDLTGFALPITGSPQGLVLVCGIHGDEVNAWPVLQLLLANYESHSLAQPANLSLYFVPTLNPDGTAANRRLNANQVDLNRNWDTSDWRTGIEISPLDFRPVGGGPRPFSEPESQAMRDLLLGLGPTHSGGLTVIYFHAAVPPNGLVTPGSHHVGDRDLADAPSRELGQLFAAAAGYEYANQWVGNYTVTGDASTWAVAQGFLSLTIELPIRTALNESESEQLYSGILAVINNLSSR